jgi:uncharacterized membrane protein (DUF485 family)
MMDMEVPSPEKHKRNGVLESINAPLGLYVLALLIVETFLAAVLIGSNLDPNDKVVGMWAGVGMFVLVVVIVTILVWFKPSHLTYDKSAHLEVEKLSFGNDRYPKKKVQPKTGPT